MEVIPEAVEGEGGWRWASEVDTVDFCMAERGTGGDWSSA